MTTSGISADLWPAPYVDGPVDATVSIPGSKSLTNRYLLLAALADGPSILRRPLHSRDSRLMIEALEAFGARVEELPGHGEYGPDLRVTPPTATISNPGVVDVDCGLAGTVMRFVPPLAAVLGRRARFDGDPHARQRPMSPIVDALRQLGATVDDDGRGGLPFELSPQPPQDAPAQVSIDASGSSQFVTALLLVGCALPGGLTVHHVGPTVPSPDHLAMTLDVLRSVGVDATQVGASAWTVAPGRIPAFDTVIEPDLSNAGPFLAAAMATAGTVRIPDWPQRTTQVGDQWRSILTRMGGIVSWDDHVLTVSGPAELLGIDVPDSSELAPTVAALAALATTESRLTGIAHLRGHETNRLAAVVTEIRRLGGRAEELDDGLAIAPAPLHAADVQSYDDHRMATFGAILGLAVPGLRVENIATTSKTMPDFPDMWQQLVSTARRA
ncbi:3-phosphoshikimate 1-carboxyvinyltransferase [Zhihengliuella flava]|uniref:3-phosphoshikimate 1-carboxyvinyltransferase n=1 Tax=Zhihengliuella flava TaxID=1285193 RepID=A0A931D7U1_9MICC|nr:3-phosphoshikimate 1-carboxyvinyltransferase [Zhihengliuella flava]MBG6083667.1 3-phosphoshikimate 1-carboxyvinyltransferase [Zhihengliuella flava]